MASKNSQTKETSPKLKRGQWKTKGLKKPRGKPSKACGMFFFLGFFLGHFFWDLEDAKSSYIWVHSLQPTAHKNTRNSIIHRPLTKKKFTGPLLSNTYFQ